MTTVAEAFVTLRPDVSRFANEVKSGLSGIGSDLTRTGAAMTAITAPIAGLGVAMVTAGGEFQRQMNRVRAVSGATGDDFDALSDQAKELGRTTQFTAGQAADAMGFLAMAGFDVQEILDAMPSTLQLAAAAQLDLGRAADITSNILTGYGLEVENLGHANDVLVKAMTSTNVDLNMLGEAFKYVGPVAKGAGVAFEEAAAAIGLMGNAGIQGSMAGTSLRGAITRLLNPTAQISAKIEELGLEVMDSQGNLQSLEEIVRQLERSGATTADMMEIFGQRAGPAMAALVDQGAEALVAMTEELGSAGGVAESVANIQMEGFHGAMLRVKSAFEGFAIALAEGGALEVFASGLERLAEKLQVAAEWFTNLNPQVQGAILIVGGLAVALGPLLIGLGALALAIGALMSPIGLVVLAIIGLTAVGVALWANWDTIKRKAGELWEGIKSAFGAGVSWLADRVFAFLDSKFAWLALALGPVGILVAVYKFRDEIVAAFEWVADKVGWFIDNTIGRLEGLLSLLGTVGGAVSNLPGVGGLGGALEAGLGLLPGFDAGGVVPGPIGAPRLVMAHGGETVLPTHKSGGALAVEAVIHQTIVLDGEVIDRRVERVTARGAQRSGMEGGYGR